jgi:hypothetical protein
MPLASDVGHYNKDGDDGIDKSKSQIHPFAYHRDKDYRKNNHQGRDN